MKVLRLTDAPPFTPFEVNIRVTSEEEQLLLHTLFFYNTSIPEFMFEHKLVNSTKDRYALASLMAQLAPCFA